MRNFPPPPEDHRKPPDSGSPWAMMYILGGVFAVVICFVLGIIFYMSNKSENDETGFAEGRYGMENRKVKGALGDDFPACRVSYRHVNTLADPVLKSKAFKLQKESNQVFEYIVRMRRDYRKALEQNGESEETVNQFMIADKNAFNLSTVLQKYITSGLLITGESGEEMRDGYYNILRVPGHYIEEYDNHQSKVSGDPVFYYFGQTPDDAIKSYNLLLSEVREFERNRYYTLFPET